MVGEYLERAIENTAVRLAICVRAGLNPFRNVLIIDRAIVEKHRSSSNLDPTVDLVPCAPSHR